MKYPRRLSARVPCLLVFLFLSCVPGASWLRAAASFEELRTQAAATQDAAEAQKLWLQLAERGDAEGQYQVGAHLRFGPVDYDGAFVWFLKAAKQGHVEAMIQLGHLYSDEEYSKLDVAEALRWWGSAAAKGSDEARSQLAMMQMYGTGMAEDRVQARVTLTELAAKNIDSAKHYLKSLDRMEGREETKRPQPPAVPIASSEPPPPIPAPTPEPAVVIASETPPSPLKPSREEEMRKLAGEFSAFEKEMAAAPSADARREAVERLGYFLRDDLHPRVLASQESGEWVLRKMIPILQRYPFEAFDLFVALPSPHVQNEMIQRICPPDVVDAINANAKRVSDKYQAREAKMNIVRQHSSAARSGDAKAQLAIAHAYLAMPRGREEEWANAIHWLTQAAKNGAPTAGQELAKLTQEVQARYSAVIAAKDMDALFQMNWQKAYSAMDDADKGALMAARILLGNPLPHAGMRARITNLLDIAVKKGNVDAMVEYGLYHVGHPNVPISEKAALEWFRKAAAAGNADAKPWVELLEPELDAAERGRRAYAAGGKAIKSHSEGSHSTIDFSNADPFFRFAAELGNGDGIAHVAGRLMETNPERARAMFEKAADLGSARAMSMLVMFHRHGSLGFAKDPKLARKWAVKAAEVGRGDDQYLAAWSLMSGEGGPADPVGARAYFLKGAAEGHTGSMYELGVMSFEGKGIAQSDAEAATWWTRASDKEHSDAKYRLALLYRDGRGVAKDLPTARRFFEELAQQGHTAAKTALAELRDAPAVVKASASPAVAAPADPAKRAATSEAPPSTETPAAAETAPSADGALSAARTFANLGLREDAQKMLLRAAAIAETGSPATKHQLAGMIFQGSLGVPRDEARAARLLQQSADGGFLPAQLDYARALHGGSLGFAADATQAEEYFRKASAGAETSTPEGKLQMAYLLVDGVPGVMSDHARAVRLIAASSESGLAQGQYEYGRVLLAGGLGEKQDVTAGIAWLEKAAAQKLPEAAFVLGELYARGTSVPQDLALSEKWFATAVANGMTQAESALQQVRDEMKKRAKP